MRTFFISCRVRIVLVIGVPVCFLASMAAPASNSGPGMAALPEGTALVVELAKSLDGKKARPGDLVKATVTQDLLEQGEIAVPRGSKLEGHITQAEESSNSKDATQSLLGIVFDRVRLKDGEEMRIHAVIVALAPPVPLPDLSAGSSVYGGAQTGGTQPTSRGASRPLVDPRDRRDHTRDDALQKASDPNSYGNATNTPEAGVLGSNNRGTFGMSGLSLKLPPGTLEPLLVSNKPSIKLENHTQMVLEIIGGGK